jgi:(p)ppGpp synthase/HD superfamily hydrolase
MWNQDLYLETLIFAGKAHHKQKVPGSVMSYVVHFTNVSMEVANALIISSDSSLDATFAIQCALLHDTIEDTTVTFDDIVREFGSRVADGVLALTKNTALPKEEQMIDSLTRIIEEGTEVRMVKMADRINNLQPPPKHWDNEKIKLYRKQAVLIYEMLGGVNPYIENRLNQKIKEYEQYIN